MKKYLVFTVLFLATLFCKAQNAPLVANGQDTTNKKTLVGDDEIHLSVDTAAVFPYGQAEFMKFFSTWVKYPPEERMKKIGGKVFVSFVVEKDGNLTQFKILKGVSTNIDKETIRVLKLSPKWIPAKISGAIVRQQVTLPFSFASYIETIR